MLVCGVAGWLECPDGHCAVFTLFHSDWDFFRLVCMEGVSGGQAPGWLGDVLDVAVQLFIGSGGGSLGLCGLGQLTLVQLFQSE